MYLFEPMFFFYLVKNIHTNKKFMSKCLLTIEINVNEN